MRFTPKSENELQMESLLPEGIYPYEVIKAEEKVSQAGNEYIKMTLKVYDSNGGNHLLFTNLALIKLLKHFCDVNGMQDAYTSGNVTDDMCLNNNRGLVQIGIEGEKPDGKGGTYKAKNIVKDYITDINHTPSAMKPLPDVKGDFHNDDIPF